MIVKEMCHLWPSSFAIMKPGPSGAAVIRNSARHSAG